jgi:hypothetical protein
MFLVGAQQQKPIFRVNPGFVSSDGMYAIKVVDNDKKLLIGGSFTSYKDVSINRLILLNTSNGNIPTSFNTGTGCNNSVFCVMEDASSKYMAGGAFTSYNDYPANRLIRINSDGSLDDTFDCSTGFNGTISGITRDLYGGYYISGLFTTFKGNTRRYIIKLNSDGSEDTGFSTGTGLNGGAHETLLDPSTNGIYISGNFSSYNGSTVGHFLKLNSDGTIAVKFTYFRAYTYNPKYDKEGYIVISGNFSYKHVKFSKEGVKYDDYVTGPAGFNTAPRDHSIDSSNNTIVVGGFTTYKATTANRIVGISPNGDINSSFDTGTGCDNTAQAIDIDSKDNIYVVSRYFTTYNGENTYGLIKLDRYGNLISL